MEMFEIVHLERWSPCTKIASLYLNFLKVLIAAVWNLVYNAIYNIVFEAVEDSRLHAVRGRFAV